MLWVYKYLIWTSQSDVYRRQILTSKVNLRAVMAKIRPVSQTVARPYLFVDLPFCCSYTMELPFFYKHNCENNDIYPRKTHIYSKLPFYLSWLD